MKLAWQPVTIALILTTLYPFCSQARENRLRQPDSNSNRVVAKRSESVLIKQRDALRLAGFDALYNIDYDQAQATFEKLTALDREYPAGYIYQAANIWLRQTHNTRRLHTSLFNNCDFHSDIINGPIICDEKLETQFRKLIETARVKAEALLKKNPRDIEALYFLGGAYATQAGYDATVTNRYFAALRAGAKAVELHRKVLKLDANFVDANLTIGLYDYVVANLPISIRMMGTLFGLHGNEARGLAEIESVARAGKYARDDARVALVTIYQREKRYDEAFALLRDLQEKFPKNYLLSLETAALLIRTDRKIEAFHEFDHLLSADSQKNIIDLVRFHYGDALLASGKFVEAIEQFLAAAQLAGCGSELFMLSHFRAGQAFDLAKNRQCAIEEYNQTLKCEDVYNIHSRAREYLKKPYSIETK